MQSLSAYEGLGRVFCLLPELFKPTNPSNLASSSSAPLPSLPPLSAHPLLSLIETYSSVPPPRPTVPLHAIFAPAGEWVRHIGRVSPGPETSLHNEVAAETQSNSDSSYAQKIHVAICQAQLAASSADGTCTEYWFHRWSPSDVQPSDH